ncbi:leucine-rich repeat protein [Lachnospiraceae bacterium 46-15]
MKRKQRFWVAVICMILGMVVLKSSAVYAEETGAVTINPVDYGADPTGQTDSAEAVWQAFEAAKAATANGASHVTVEFPEGEYHIYKDKAQQREYHTSNTNSIENPTKWIGLLIEGQENFTLQGNGSLFMFHGNMMALAVVNSRNVTLEDFSWDFGVPTISEMTVTGTGTASDGKPYTEYRIPACFPYEITGNTITWNSEKSPYTQEYYWTQTGIHNPSYGIVAYQPGGEMSRNYYTSAGPFTNVSSIQEIDDTDNTGDAYVRIVYTSKTAQMEELQKQGAVIQLAANAHRQTAGAFTWESENVTARKVNVHYMHGFGWLIQMSKNVYYYECNLVPRENSGHIVVSFADGIHASGAAGDLVIEDCNFANTHDDPINLHGTFTRVEQRVSDKQLVLKYIHNQQGGFPQFHAGDKVAFFTRDTLESTDNETLYTVASVVNPGESGNDLRTMQVTFEETLPSNLSDKIGNEPKYVAENVTYAPKVTIRNCTFQQVPTRGILCTTRNPVLIEGNTFKNMSMATIFLSNDSDEWYESGPIRDMTIRNNEFYIKSIGRTSWEYAPAVYIHPVTKGGGLPSAENPIHKNIMIDGNIFHMDCDTVVKAESVENLTIKNNVIVRTNPDISLEIRSPQTSILAGEKLTLNTEADGNRHTAATENVYEFTKCKNVTLEGNTYDDGLKMYAVLSNMPDEYLNNKDKDITAAYDRNQPAAEAVSDIQYKSSAPEILSVDKNGRMTAKKAGTAEVWAYYVWNGEEILSNKVAMTVVSADELAPEDVVTINGEDNQILDRIGAELSFSAHIASGKAVTWSVEDFLTGGATDAASIDANGTLTAQKNGIVLVKAMSGLSVDRKIVLISIPKTGNRNADFTVTREDAENYTLTEDKITIDMQTGDLYNNDNTVKNLFLYQIPESLDRNNLRTVIKIENLPVKESGQWDTASFFLYKDDDNYISCGKKSHYDGIATVAETNGSAVETGGDAAQNELSSAYLGFYKNGNTVSVDFKMENGQWQHVRDVSGDMLGSSYKIGFSAWETNDRGKTAIFSGLRVGSGSTSYEQLCAQDSVSFMEPENQAPAAADAAFDSESYEVGDTVTVNYAYSDPDGDDEGKTLFCFTYSNGIKEVTESPSLKLEYEGTVECRIYPVDKKGRPGMQAVTAKVQVNPAKIPGDPAGLQNAVEEAEKLNLEIYTAESVEKFQSALQEARRVLASGLGQEEIDEALRALQKAREELKEKPPEDNQKPSEGEQKPPKDNQKPVIKEPAIVPAVGTVIVSGGVRYKVTKSDAKNGTAAAVKLEGKKKSEIVIADIVKKDGFAFKVTAVNQKAFQKNKKMKSLVIGANVKKIGSAAFYKCAKLKKITFKGKAIPQIGKKAFKGIAAKCKITVPKKTSAKQLKKWKKKMKAAGAGSRTVYKKK